MLYVGKNDIQAQSIWIAAVMHFVELGMKAMSTSHSREKEYMFPYDTLLVDAASNYSLGKCEDPTPRRMHFEHNAASYI